MKVCTKCHIEKDESEFRRRRGKTCIRCYKKQQHSYYLKSKSRIREFNTEYKKICTKCGDEKLSKYFIKCRNKDGLSNICSTCLSIYNKKYRKENKIKLYEKRKVYMLKNPKKRVAPQRHRKIKQKKEFIKKWDWGNKETVKKYFRQWSKMGRETLSDTYVLQQLMCNTGLPARFFRSNKDLIELKRLEIKTKRLLKQKNKNYD